MITCTGTIKASDINTELGRTPSSIFHLDGSDERSLAGKPSGLIKFSDFYCKSMSFDLTIGYRSLISGSMRFAGFNTIAGYSLGYINGVRPSPLFPAGYGGADQQFYVTYLGTSYGNGNGTPIVLFRACTGPQFHRDNGIAVFGHFCKVKYVFSDNSTYEYILPSSEEDGGSISGFYGTYASREYGDELENLLRNHNGQVAKISVSRYVP